MASPLGTECPCGSGSPYPVCCGPLHAGAPAPTAEALMRSRYSAYVVGDAGYLARTWHPRTRPLDVTPDPTVVWSGLEVLRTEAGGPDDEVGVVEFRARLRTRSGPGELHEVSRFERRRGRWVYTDGDWQGA